MSDKRDPFQFALSVGATAAVVFLIAFLWFLFSHPDPQSGIGLCLSPFFAAWIGVSVGLIAFSWQFLARPNPAGGLSTAFCFLLLALGMVGFILISGFLASEFYQLTHSTVIGQHTVIGVHSADDVRH